MAFTYMGDRDTDRDRVRFWIQDTVSGAGPKKDGGNFTDAEIDGLVTNEGSWQRGVAAAFEALTAHWSTQPSFQADGLMVNTSDVAQRFQEQAQEWRRKHGGARSTRAGSRGVTRVDGYSSDVSSHDT